mgnify:CR=1 FL=1
MTIVRLNPCAANIGCNAVSAMPVAAQSIKFACLTVAPSNMPSGMPATPVSRPMPLFPACMARQTASRSPPTAVTIPMPVITIRSSRSPLNCTVCPRLERSFGSNPSVKSVRRHRRSNASWGFLAQLRRSPCWQAFNTKKLGRMPRGIDESGADRPDLAALIAAVPSGGRKNFELLLCTACKREKSV